MDTPKENSDEIEKKLEEIHENTVAPVSFESEMKPCDREIPRRVTRHNYQDGGWDDSWDDDRR